MLASPIAWYPRERKGKRRAADPNSQNVRATNRLRAFWMLASPIAWYHAEHKGKRRTA